MGSWSPDCRALGARNDKAEALSAVALNDNLSQGESSSWFACRFFRERQMLRSSPSVSDAPGIGIPEALCIGIS